MSASVASRMGKLRRMAEHPTANKHEAELARRELERLKKAGHAEDPDSSHRFMRMEPHFGEQYRAAVEEMKRRQAAGVREPGESGYYDWARTLKVGDSVRVGAIADAIKSWRTGQIITVVRMTSSQYVMSNGDRYRRSGKHPGYKVGENGRDGTRHYLLRLVKQ